MKITINEILKRNLRKAGQRRLYAQLGEDYPKSHPFDLEDLIGGKNTLSDIIWCVRHYLSIPNLSDYAIYCAETILPIFEDAFPNDARPRNAIAAAADINIWAMANDRWVANTDTTTRREVRQATSDVSAAVTTAADNPAARGAALTAATITTVVTDAATSRAIALDASITAEQATIKADRPDLLLKMQDRLKQIIRGIETK